MTPLLSLLFVSQASVRICQILEVINELAQRSLNAELRLRFGYGMALRRNLNLADDQIGGFWGKVRVR